MHTHCFPQNLQTLRGFEEKENGKESKEKIKERGMGKIGGKGEHFGGRGHEVEFQKEPY